MKRILFLSTFVFLGFRLNSCSDTDLDSPVNETNQPVEIKVKGTNIKDYKKDLVQRCKSNQFIIEEGVNTMNELLQIRNFINSKDEIGVWKKLGISACGIDSKDEKVIVMLEDVSEMNITNFKNEVINSPLIKFCQLSFSKDNASVTSR